MANTTFKKPTKRFSLILPVILLILALGAAAYVHNRRVAVGQQSTENIALTTTAAVDSPTHSPSTGPANELTDLHEAHEYVHPLGFKLIYPKYNRSHGSCESYDPYDLDVVPLQIYEDPAASTLYISEAQHLKITWKESDGGTSEKDSCEVIPNSLELIKDGYENGQPDFHKIGNNISRPHVLQVSYKKIDRESDLQRLVDSMPLYKGCYVGKRQLAEGSNDVNRITLLDEHGERGFESGCLTNFVYYFLYSPKNKVAVLTDGFQEANFNGANGQSMIVIEFPDKLD